MAVTAYTFPGSVRKVSGNNWANLNNILADDGAFAASSSSGLTTEIRLEDFGFSIPSTATIDGIEVEYENLTPSGPQDTEDFAAQKGGVVQTAPYTDQATSRTATVRTLGGPTALWNATWTPADINAIGTSGFGFSIFIDTLNFTTGHQFDYLKARIYYTDSGAGGDATVNLTGVSGTGSLGTVSLQVSSQATLTGVSATGAVGDLTVGTGTRVTLTGVSGTAGIGTLSFTATASPTLTGVSATGSAGTLTALTGTVVNLTGVAGTGSVGSLSVTVADTVTLTGASATGQIGTLSVVIPSSASVDITGVSATGSAGEVTVTISGVWVKQNPASTTWTLITPNTTTWTVQ